jgi:hypothetical protein
MKIYNDNNKKYKGEAYNILDIKLQIFYDYCLKNQTAKSITL